MRQAYVVEITTPKKYLLNGLWFGPAKAKRAIIWVHGLTSSAWSGGRVIERLVSKDIAVLTFNNRGHDSVTRISRVLKSGKKKSEQAGAAHEVFEECVDDIQGAIDFVRSMGAKEIYLAGHSTGCQKSVFYAAQKRVDPRLKGIILLAPVSDYAGALKNHGKSKLDAVAALARMLVKNGKPHELLPATLWSEEPNDAQRFLSLYTPESREEIFCYAQKGKVPSILRSVKVPILVLWAAKDEYADRGAKEVEKWFRTSITSPHDVVTIARATHNFRGGEEAVARKIRSWLH